jgi:membrane associated rhomboid family serine protease
MSESETGTAAQSAVPVCFKHPGRETYVRCVRCDRPICPDCMNSASVGFQCPDCVREGNRSVREARTAFGGGTAGAQGQVTKTLLGLNVVMWVLSVVGALLSGRVDAREIATLVTNGGYSPVTEWGAAVALLRYPDGSLHGIAVGEFYRLVTSDFLHFGLLHLGLNMYALWLLGRECERLLGRWRFAVLYLLAGVGGAAAVYSFGNLNIIAAGASSSIFGLMGALFFFFRRMNVDVRGLVGLLVLNLVITFLVPQISILGHIGGLVTGAAVGAIMAYAPRGAARLAVQVGGILLVVLVLATMVVVRTGQLAPLVAQLP